MTATPIYKDQNFFAPTFLIKLKGQDIGREVIRDVLEVTYTDDFENLDSFEFALNDWEPVLRLPKYSSPWDENGQPRMLDGDVEAPSFEPGADVELHMGFQGEEEPVLMMTGEVVSITPSFPAAGAPTCRIRALNLLHKLTKKKISGSFAGTNLEIAAQIAEEMGVSTQAPEGVEEPEAEAIVVENENPFLEILNRVRRAGYSMWLEEGEGGPVLHIGTAQRGPTYELEWGKTLISFSPTLSTKGQVSEVHVRVVDPAQSGDAQRVFVAATWDDLDVDRSALGPQSGEEIDAALSDSVEEITDSEARTEEEARAVAMGRLREIAQDLIKGAGATVGAPELRAGRRVEIKGLGPRFSGAYQVTQSTHSIGSSGYTTSFQARKEILP